MKQDTENVLTKRGGGAAHKYMYLFARCHRASKGFLERIQCATYKFVIIVYTSLLFHRTLLMDADI